MRKSVFGVGAIGAGLVSVGAAQAAAPLLGVAFRDPSFVGNTTLYDIDPVSGAATNPREVGADVITGLSFSPGGELFALTDQFANVNGVPVDGALVTIDPATGGTTFVGNVGELPTGGFVTEGDLDFDPATGELFSVTSNNGTSTLFVIDTATAAPTEIGTIPIVDSDMSAMAFDANGDLWMLNTDFDFVSATRESTLLRINPSSALVEEEFPLSVALGATAGMDFDPATGELFIADGDFAGTNDLYTFDFGSGDLELVGATGLDGGASGFGGLAGLEFIPAPGSAALLGMAGVAATRRRR